MIVSNIVSHSNGVTLLGASEFRPEDLRSALQLAPFLVAADGGAMAALDQGLLPQAVIGDMDSLSEAARARIPPERIHRISEQESTDFEKALRGIGAAFVLGVGFLGGRLDHQLAVLHGLVRHTDPPCLLISQHEVVLHVRRRLLVDLDPGDIVSLFPLAPLRARSEGLEWPLDGLDLAPGRRIGTSNRATGPILIEPECPGLLAMLPRRALKALTRLFPEGR